MIFDPVLQKDVPHTISLNPNGNGELIFTSTESGHFLKFPAGLSKEDVEKLIVKHKESNAGQVTMEKFKEAENKLVDAFSDGEIEDKKPADVKPEDKK